MTGKFVFGFIMICFICAFVACTNVVSNSVVDKTVEVDSLYGNIRFEFHEGEKVMLTYMDESSKALEGTYIQEMDKITIFVYDYEYLASFDGHKLVLISEGISNEDDKKTGSKSEELITYDHNGRDRGYVLKLPENYKNRPLVLVLHGFSGDVLNADDYIGFGQVGSDHDFTVCYPQGLSGKEKDGAYWNANWGLEGDPDDIDFISSLALDLVEKYELDRERIFVCGYSNGGFMSYSLALNAPDIFSSAAVIGGLMSEQDWKNMSQAQPVSILHIHGNDDSVIEIENSVHYKISVDEIIDYWRRVNGADDLFEESFGNHTSVYKYEGSKHDVWYYRISDWGHEIPNDIATDFNAAEIVWSFFDRE